MLYLNNQPTFLLVDALISRSNHQTFHVLGVLRGIKRHLLHHKNSKDEMEIPQESTNTKLTIILLGKQFSFCMRPSATCVLRCVKLLGSLSSLLELLLWPL